MTDAKRRHEIIEFVTTDAYTDEEVMGGWGVALDDAVDRPFEATALGKPVTVLSFESDTQHGIRCEIQGEGIRKRWVGIDALDTDSLPKEVQDVLNAFDAWSEGNY